MAESNKLKLFTDRPRLQTPIMPYLTHNLPIDITKEKLIAEVIAKQLYSDQLR